MMTAFILLFSAGCMDKAAEPDEHPSAGIIEGFHRLSYYAGTIAAATEFVGAGAKKLALSSTYTEEEYDQLAEYASREAEKHGVATYVERDLLVTRLFRPDIAKDKIVIMFAYTEQILEEYRALKEMRAKAVEEGNLEDISEEIAWKFGKLLSYADEKILELLEEQRNSR
jgi:broad specificity polyphosphatase/5'/3'-nucleotidase SurE